MKRLPEILAVLLLICYYNIVFSGEVKKSDSLLVFKGKLLSVVPTGKRHQSYIFTFEVEKIIKGKYKNKEVSFECYAGYHGNEILKNMNCRPVKNEEEEYECLKKHAVVSLLRKKTRKSDYFLFSGIEVEE